MVFDAHADILSDVMEQFEKGNDIWHDYHLPLYQAGEIKFTVLINYSDPFKEKQKEYFNQVNKVSLPYFKNHNSVNVFHENGFDAAKINIVFGIEGLNVLQNMTEIKKMYELGYRLFGLTWNEKNQFAASCLYSNGLTKLGEEVIKYANTKNILIDLAHSSKQTFMDVAKLTNKPLFVSHSGARSLCDTPRNLDDEQLELIKKTNGVVGVFNIGKFLSDNKSTTSITTYVDHIDYIVNKIGIDYVGLGLDFCYYLDNHLGNSNTAGLERISDVNNIFIELKKRGYNDEEIEKIKFNNMYRIVSNVIRPIN